MTQNYDYIVVGGGSAGCVAAAKLAGAGGMRTLLLEAGYSHRHPLLDMPPGIFKMINGSKFMRYHQTVPQEHLDGRVHDIPQANVLGGGSSVNAQVYIRGRPSDYDEWHNFLGNKSEMIRRRAICAADMAPNQRELKSTFVRAGSRILQTCCS